MEPITIIALIISMAACLGAYMFKKIYSNKSSGGMTGVYVYSALGCIVSAVVLLVWGGFDGISVFTAVMGLLFGLAISLGEIFMIKALRSGPMSFTMVICSCSTIFTALSGFLFFEENIGVFQLAGIALMMISFIFATEKKKDEKKGSFIWLLFCALAFTCSGAIGFMQKTHQASSAHKGEINTFLVLSFIVSFVFSTVLALISMKRENKPLIEKKKNGKIYWFILIIMIDSGICVAANHKLNLGLSGQIPSAVFFPLVNGGNLVLTTLSAFIIFKEKLSPKKWVGVIVGIVAVLLLCMPAEWIFSFNMKDIFAEPWSYKAFINSLG